MLRFATRSEHDVVGRLGNSCVLSSASTRRSRPQNVGGYGPRSFADRPWECG